MAKLFLDGIFQRDTSKNDSPSTIYITMPNPGANFREINIIAGLMVGDPSWSVGNKWGPIINDLSSLQDWASLIGSQSQFSWINASTMCWKGTNPISISAEFYLINYAPNLNLEKRLSMLVKLAAIEKGTYSNGTLGNFIVNVHGGYAADVISGNNSAFKAAFTRKQDINAMVKGDQNEAASALGSLEGELYRDGNAKGAVAVRFGHKITIRNLLVSKIDVTESNIEVADQNGGNQKPLYYRVSVQFTGVRPLITTDVDNMFGTSPGAYPTADPTAATAEAPTTGFMKRVENFENDHPMWANAIEGAIPVIGPARLIYRNLKNSFTSGN